MRKMKSYPLKKNINLEKSKMSIEDFFELRAVPMQRNTEAHAQNKKVKESLSILKPEHLDIALAKLTKDIHHGDVFYRKGSIMILNGNTRKYFWENGLSDFIPQYVDITYYPIETIEEMKETYNSFDSTVALETNGHKIWGLLKSDHNFTPKSNKISSGKFTSALHFSNHALDPVTYNEPTVNMEKIQDELAMFINEIKVMDEICDNNKTTRKIIWDQPLLAASFLALKHYGTNNTKLLKCLNDINDQKMITTSVYQDGVTHIVYEWLMKLKFKQRTTSWDKDCGFSKTVPFVLFWIDKYMNDITQKQIGGGWDNILIDWFGPNSKAIKANTIMANAFDVAAFDVI
jgi:hypothetical protein